MGNHRWRGYEHPELYTMINEGPGAAASEPQTTYWQGLTEELTTVDQDLNDSLGRLGARWEGDAAESANAGLTPLAAWATDAQTGSGVMKVSSEDQAEYISDARAKMPEPIEVTTQAPSTWDQVAAGAAMLTGNAGPAMDVAAQAADHEAQEAAQSEAEARAVETMETYESSSTWNRSTLGTFVAPPDVVVSTPEPQGGTATAVAYKVDNTKNVADNGTGVTTTSSTSQTNGTHVNTVQQPTGTTNTSHVNTPVGNNVGNTIGNPPVTNPNGVTTPSNVYTPTTPNPNNPYLPGQGPNQLPSQGQNNPYLPTGYRPGGGDNAGDVARRALPPLTGGRGGISDPLGGRGGLPGGIDGERSPSQLGRGLPGGGLAGENGVVRSGPGAAGAAGARGNGVNGPMGAGGRRGEGEEDDEHFAPDYLMENDNVFGDDRRVAPTVIGE